MFRILISLIIFMTPAALFADSDLQNRIDVAGRQRMLSQRIVRAACNIQIGIATTENRGILNASRDLFIASLAALKEGGGPLDFAAETDPEALETLARIETVWSDFDATLNDLSNTKDVKFKEFDALSQISLALLSSSNALVEQLGARYKQIAGDGDPALGRMINIAGRQRMLIQKAGKEACLVQMAEGSAAISSRISDMNATLALFEKSAFGLTFSSRQLELPPPPTPMIEAANFDHWQDWVSISSLFASLEDRKLDNMELLEISEGVEYFLKALNTTVGHYTLL